MATITERFHCVIGEHYLAIDEIFEGSVHWVVSLNCVTITEPCQTEAVAQAVFDLIKRALEAADHA